MELSSLEEVSLHQQNIERIEHLGRWCPKLQILLLQGNVITKIENLNRLKDLIYLNLALNCIERVEDLENCEQLQKLDLTANFIIELSLLSSLSGLQNLRELYLTGNPCTQYEGYRSWVVHQLPQLDELDGKKILRSERLKARHNFNQVHSSICRDENSAIAKREIQKLKSKQSDDETNEPDDGELDDDLESIEKWNSESTENTPESRISLSREMERRHRKHERKTRGTEKKQEIKYFAEDGRPLNMNKADLDFEFKEDEINGSFVLEVKLYKYVNEDDVTCDVTPQYVRVTLKGQPLQIVYPSEVKSDSATAQRSRVTGHLVVTAPKIENDTILCPRKSTGKKEKSKKLPQGKSHSPERESSSERKYLEIDDPTTKWIITEDPKNCINKENQREKIEPRPESPDFKDDPDVPPLD